MENMKEYTKFSQADELIKAIHLMNNRELKFLFYTMVKREKGKTIVKTNLTEIINYLNEENGGKQRKTYKKVINNILSKSVMSVQMKADRLTDDERELLGLDKNDMVVVSGSLLSAKMNVKSKEVIIEFKKEFIPLLDDLKYNHTWIIFEQMIKLKGMYSPRFYEFCKMILKDKSSYTYTWYIDNNSDKAPGIRTFLNITNKHKEWRDLKRKVIEPSIKEINEKCDDMNIEYEVLKNGYKRPAYAIKLKLTAIKFQRNNIKDKKLEESKKNIEFTDEVKNLEWWNFDEY